MKLLRLIVCLTTWVFCVSALAQSPQGRYLSPYDNSPQLGPLKSLKLRLGPPVLPFGPSAYGDMPETFVCPTPNASGCYVFNANQAPLETSATSPTSGYSGTAAGSAPLSVGTTPQTSGYGPVVGGTTTQVIGYNFNTSPIGTSTFPSSWSQPFADHVLGAVYPGTATDDCGAWPISTWKYAGTEYMRVHNEGPCDYPDPLGTVNVTVNGAASAGQPSFNVTSTSGLVVGMQPFAFNTGGLTGQIASISGLTITMSSNLSQPLTNSQVITLNEIGYTNMSGSIWASTLGAKDGGPGTWTPLTGAGSPGTFISSLEPIKKGWLTGIGDGTIIVGDDGYLYDYSTYYSDGVYTDYTIVISRAPITNPAPGNWQTLYQGCFCAPSLNNPYNAAADAPYADLQYFTGSYAATMSTQANPSLFKVLIPDGKNHDYWRKNIPHGQNIAGIGLSISLDYKSFYTFPAPLVNYDFSNFNGRPSFDDLYVYAVFRDDVTGGSTLDPSHFALWSIYVPPNNSLSSRYFVEWPVVAGTLSKSEQNEGIPQIAVALETWHNTSTGNPYSGRYRTTTVNPTAGVTPATVTTTVSGVTTTTVNSNADGITEPGWFNNQLLGYVATNCPNSTADIASCDANGIANRIGECWSGEQHMTGSAADNGTASNDDYMLVIDANGTSGSCSSGWKHARTIGWLYKNQPPFGGNEIFSCYNSTAQYHFAVANDNTCGGLGGAVLLGWALAS